MLKTRKKCKKKFQNFFTKIDRNRFFFDPKISTQRFLIIVNKNGGRSVRQMFKRGPGGYTPLHYHGLLDGAIYGYVGRYGLVGKSTFLYFKVPFRNGHHAKIDLYSRDHYNL